MFSIICSARKGHSHGVRILALVDRSKTRQMWWVSDDPSVMQTFATRKEADEKLRGLTQNSPRVVSSAEARALLLQQRQAHLESVAEADRKRMDREGLDAMEEGWDGHKNVF